VQAFLWNLSVPEIALIAIVSVLVFGRRLPQVAGQAMRNLSRMRRHLDNLRRESGIEREIYDVKESFQDLAREASAPPPSAPYPGNEDRVEPESGEEQEGTDEQEDPDEARGAS
jgi:Sec-independent protein translocase protein TatA